jgi:hypothetical protein
MAKSETYKLKDPATTFYDPETKLKVVGDKAVEIDVKGRGKLTLAAINAGGLIAVSTKPDKAPEAGAGKGAAASGKGKSKGEQPPEA